MCMQFREREPEVPRQVSFRSLRADTSGYEPRFEGKRQRHRGETRESIPGPRKLADPAVVVAQSGG